MGIKIHEIPSALRTLLLQYFVVKSITGEGHNNIMSLQIFCLSSQHNLPDQERIK